MALPESITIATDEFSGNEMRRVDVTVSAEYLVTVKLNNNPYVSIACSGSDMEFLAVGHLISEGIVSSIKDIKKIDIDENSLEINISLVNNDELLERLFRIHSIASGCGHGRSFGIENEMPGIANLPEIEAETITSCMKRFLKSSELHMLTRGVHSAALYRNDGEEMVFFDEIGRHNAVDKILGFAAKNNIALSNTMILSTGRVSSEIIYKMVFSSAPVIVSKSSPTSLSIELAKKHNIMMIAKVRGNTFCIFQGSEKIK